MTDASAELVEVRLLRLPVEIHVRARRHAEGLQRELELIRRGTGDHSATPARLLTLVEQLYDEFDGAAQEPSRELRDAVDRGLESIDLVYRVRPSAGRAAERLRSMLEEIDDYCRARQLLLNLVTPPDCVAYRTWYLGEFTRQTAGEPPLPWDDRLVDVARAAAPGPEPEVAPRPPTMPEGWTYHSADGRVAVSITGPLDLESAPMFRDVLVAALAGSGDVTVDLRGCDFVDSVGVSVIVVALQRADDEDRALRFRLGGAAERVLRTSGLLDHIDIVEP